MTSDVLPGRAELMEAALAAAFAARFNPGRRYGAGHWNCWSGSGRASTGGRNGVMRTCQIPATS
ncbi:MAG TPA: hypothetical protein VF060_27900 [Trebonia sp.]